MKGIFADKRVPLYILFNFMVGAVLGTILFYAQLKSQGIDSNLIEISFNTKVNWIDIFSLFYLNALWFISIFIAYRILPSTFFHPIIMARGVICTFSVSYIINFSGVLHSAAAVIPQCLSILPALVFFSAVIIQRRKNALLTGREMFNITRLDILLTLVLAMGCAVVESLIFGLFCAYLF